jgi:hypothetical protein
MEQGSQPSEQEAGWTRASTDYLKGKISEQAYEQIDRAFRPDLYPPEEPKIEKRTTPFLRRLWSQ